MRLSVFTKIFLVFLLTISPLYLLSAYLYAWGRNQIRHEIYTSTLNNIDFYISNVEIDIERAINTSVQLINNPDIHYIGALDSWPADYMDIFRRVNLIQRELDNLQNISEYVQEAHVLFPHSGVKVTYRSRLTMSEFDFARVNDTSFYTGFPFVTCPINGGIYINFSSQYHLAHYGQPSPERIRWVIVTKIDVDRIAEDIHSFFTGDFDQIAFIGDSSGLTIKTHVNEDTLPDILQMVSASQNNLGIKNLRIDSQSILVAYRKSPSLRTTFLLFAEEQQLVGILTNYWMWIMTGIAAILLVAFTIITRKVTTNMLNAQRATLDKLHEQELLIKDTELKMLQYQINPHFLYNTFFTMYQLLQARKYDGLGQVMSSMGRYFNFITKSDNYIPLAEEIAFCLDYLEIQTIRFANRITAEIDGIPEGCGHILIPRLTIQPLLENCFKHGLINKETGGIICLHFNYNAECIIISIEDNGDELTDADLQRVQNGLAKQGDSKTIGIYNVHKRLQSYFGGQYGIKTDRSELGGLRVQVMLPIE
ncbi:MAG: histidine kinase [Firmicutes bacterium]|nr:histidine kinase [Bacillota bacterium]